MRYPDFDSLRSDYFRFVVSGHVNSAISLGYSLCLSDFLVSFLKVSGQKISISFLFLKNNVFLCKRFLKQELMFFTD